MDSAAPLLQRYGTLLCLVLLTLGFSFAVPDAFASTANLLNLLQQITTLAIVAVGATFVMVIGEFDLSVGFVASLSAVIAFALFGIGAPVAIGVAAAMLAGIGAGAANGILVARFEVPSFVATLAVGTILSGLAYWASGGTSLFSGVPDSFKALGRGSLLGLPVLSIWMAAVLICAAVTFGWTRYGRRIHAIGANIQAARLTGLPVRRDRVVAFAITGGLSALAGLLLAARLGSVQHTMGEALLLPAYAAAFLGAAASRSGIPNIGGTFLGVLIAGVIANGLTILGAEPFIQRIITGAIILAAVLIRHVGRR
ncbi:MAG: ABC transporter permease [Rhizobiales bacterium]|nr:ABC transporter permease [Hyphomicrobiales bacterium]